MNCNCNVVSNIYRILDRNATVSFDSVRVFVGTMKHLARICEVSFRFVG